jgi:Uma2 family endonuclease
MAPEIVASVSIEEFWRWPRQFPRAELVAGRIVDMAPPGARHALLVTRLGRRLDSFVTDRGLGVVSTEAGFILSTHPPTVRSPDVAVVFKERVPSPAPVRFFAGSPHLAVEVLSPDDRPAEIAAKIGEYLQARSQAIWVVDSESKTVTAHTAGGAMRYARDEVMHGAPPLPELRLPVQELFAELDYADCSPRK